MNKPKVSIILPTYNVEKYLSQCLDSIANQTYKNIEVIIVIDGATDRSYEIAEQFCQQDSRFHVYWQENAGSGPARNNGLSKSSGEFIMFVDPDDWCKPDYVENLLRLQQEDNYDLVLTSETTIFFSKTGNVKKVLPSNLKDAVYYGKDMLHKKYLSLFLDGYIHAPHCKIYKSSIIKDNCILFPDLRRSQDIIFNYRYYDHVQSIKLSSYSGYMYRVKSKDRTLRLKHDYYATIGLIYNDIKALSDKWGISFNKELASTSLFGMIYSLFESNVLRGEKIQYIVDDTTINEIILNAKPKRIHLCLVKHLVMHKCYLSTEFLVKLVLYIKLIFQ